MAEQCPYLALCSRETRLEPDKIAAATQVLRGAIGDSITGEERRRKGLSWETTGNSCVIPLEHLSACNTMCDGYVVFAGSMCFEGVSPVEGQIGAMLTEEDAALLNLAGEERIHCVRYQHFATSVEIEFPEA